MPEYTSPQDRPLTPPLATALPRGVVCSHAKLARTGIRPANWPEYESPRWLIPLAKRPGYGFFAFVLAALREHLPTPFPTAVLTSKVPPNIDGFCVRRPSKFVIQLDRRLTCEAAVQCLIHEWAHARAWNHRIDQTDPATLSPEEFEGLCHGPEFGAAYAEAWRLLTTRILPAWTDSGLR
jgi:hypothetical protein